LRAAAPVVYRRGMSRGRLAFWCLLVASLIAAPSVRRVAAAGADDSIRVLAETPLSAAADIPPAVRNECREIGRELPNAIVRSNRGVTLVKNPKELTARRGKYLVLEITQVRAKGGGVITGPKHMVVRGVLYEHGKEIADFEGERASMASASTCSSLDKAEKALGTDIARWLEHPHPHDRLAN
jgi:hypothetical protein